MLVFIYALTILACIFLALVILIQNPKGGGLDSSFSSANQIGGVKRTTDFLEKSTWTLGVVLFVLCLGAAALHEDGMDTTAPIFEETLPEMPIETPGGESGDQEMPVEEGE